MVNDLKFIGLQCKTLDNAYNGFTKEKKESLFRDIDTSLKEIEKIKKITKTNASELKKFQEKIKKCFTKLESCVHDKEKKRFDTLVSKVNKTVVRKLQKWKTKHLPKKERNIIALVKSCSQYHTVPQYLPKGGNEQKEQTWNATVEKVERLMSKKKNHFRLNGSGYVAEALGVSRSVFDKHADPKKRMHIYGTAIKPHFTSWLEGKNDKGIRHCIAMSFDDYMKTKVVPRLDKKSLHALQNNDVRFCGAEERKQFAVTFKRHKVLIKGKSLRDGEYMFVLGPDNKLYMAKKVKGKLQHSSFFAGDSVPAVGKCHVKGSKIRTINFQSGHYKPTKKVLHVMKAYLKDRSRLGSEIKSVVFAGR